MRAAWSPSLAILLLAVGPAAGQAGPTVTVYRCTDARGQVSLQDHPCPPGESATRREMQRPQDPPPRPARDDEDDARDRREPAPPAPEPPPPAFVRQPPPPLFECTDFDGAVRYSEDYDPHDRCVPLGILGYDLRGAPPEVLDTCRWVRESCVRLDDVQACRQFERLLAEARSDALHAFSDTAAFRKSEVRRLEQITGESCR